MGFLGALRCFSSTRRENVWVMELVVMKPKRRRRVPLVRSMVAAMSHQYITKSMESVFLPRDFHRASA